jgi:hypothetical protein
MTIYPSSLTTFAAALIVSLAGIASAADFQSDVKPFLLKYCAECHSGKEANADIDFTLIETSDHVDAAFETWEAVVEQLRAHTMPPEDETQPTDEARKKVFNWYAEFVRGAEARPAPFRARRLSVSEYRNTLRSVFGFDLEIAVAEAEQTISERSRVVKLLPIDPPGKSGFKNDTHENPLTVVVWDQYSYLVDAGLEELFSPQRRQELEAFTGSISSVSKNDSSKNDSSKNDSSKNRAQITNEQAKQLIRKFVPRAWRRGVPSEELDKICERIEGLSGRDLTKAVKFELKTVLMSPSFVYRGLRMPIKSAERQAVDNYELAERLSYFLWADMPDDQLIARAADGTLTEPAMFEAEIDRMIGSPKARSLADVFAVEWFTLKEIENLVNNPPNMVALKSQPLDFMNYLFTENRPLLELVDSDTAFISPFTAGHYGPDSKQMKRYVKQRGIEVEIVPNQKIQLNETAERGGILTMPGILAMNKGPIIRGVWILERILGEHLPEPPANVGQVAGNKRGENLTFRQRFEQHRSNATCAVCHNKIDPLGFALEGFNGGGGYMLKNYKPSKKDLKKGEPPAKPNGIDTSGQLPTGEKFDGIVELKKILTTSQREQVLRNIVKRTMSYALCRKLKIHDQPTVESIVKQMDESNGTWRDLFQAVANSPQFRETMIPVNKVSQNKIPD